VSGRAAIGRSRISRPSPPWKWVSLATILVVGIGLAWRTLRYALAFPLWGDEAFLAVNFLTRDLAGLALPLEYDQIAPPGFLWAGWGIVRWLGPGERAIRLLPYLASVASLLVFWGFCRRVASRRVVLVAVALLAASFYPVRHGNEVKPYAVDLLTALVITALGWSVWLRPRSAARWLALIAAATAGVWLSYIAVFPASSVAMLLALRVARERSARSLAFGASYAALLGISFAAVVLTFAGTQASDAAWLAESVTWKDAFPPLARPWRLPWWLLTIHTGGMLAYPHGSKNFGSTATFLLVALGTWTVWRRRARRPLLLLLLGPLPVALAAAALHRYPYGTCVRVTIYIAPAVCLLAAEGALALLRLRRGWSARGPIVLAGLLAAIPVAFSVRDVAMPYRRWDEVEHRRLADRLAALTAPGDRWIVFNGATPPPSHVPGVMVSYWIQRVAEVHFYLQSRAPVPVHWEPDPSTVGRSPTGRTWFVVHKHGCPWAYPHARLAAYHAALASRLGVPRPVASYRIEDDETLEVFAFHPANEEEAGGAVEASPPPPKRPTRLSSASKPGNPA
jgi:hypothetical protein